MCRSVKEFYNAAGAFKPMVNLIRLDIKPLLDEAPFSAWADEMMAKATCRKAEAHEWEREAA
ncbi:MAG TPA: hypothetical protein P5102_05660 [Candidatus Competibacteraceae bacterium]|nr:hypothetical protein [Candidatus Competibacteraceae bacterium]HSA45541.1 hypothetical protein [Candidatus Competibacteraceae bacterium]